MLFKNIAKTQKLDFFPNRPHLTVDPAQQIKYNSLNSSELNQSDTESLGISSTCESGELR